MTENRDDMRVVVLSGLPGVGKLTVAKEMARLWGYRVFHNHLVFDAVEALEEVSGSCLLHRAHL